MTFVIVKKNINQDTNLTIWTMMSKLWDTYCIGKSCNHFYPVHYRIHRRCRTRADKWVLVLRNKANTTGYRQTRIKWISTFDLDKYHELKFWHEDTNNENYDLELVALILMLSKIVQFRNVRTSMYINWSGWYMYMMIYT